MWKSICDVDKTAVVCGIVQSIPNPAPAVQRCHIPLKRSYGTYIQYDSDGDICLKALLVEEYVKEMKAHFSDIIEESSCIRSLWKIKLIVGMVFEYDNKQ